MVSSSILRLCRDDAFVGDAAAYSLIQPVKEQEKAAEQEQKKKRIRLSYEDEEPVAEPSGFPEPRFLGTNGDNFGNGANNVLVKKQSS